MTLGVSEHPLIPQPSVALAEDGWSIPPFADL